MKQIEEIKKHLNIASSRKYWIIIPFLLSLLGGLTYALKAQPMFRGETLILVVPQKVPEGYVRSLVQLTMEERLQTIQQQVTSRTNLENIMAEHRLFSEPGRADIRAEEKIMIFRKRIKTNVVKGSAFGITFDYEDPQKAMEVTNKLASNFIRENLKLREDQALGTSEFLQGELNAIRNRLEEQEEIIKRYRQQHLGGLPQDLAANLSTLQRLQSRLEQLNTNLSAAEDRRLTVQQQMSSQKMVDEQLAAALLRDSQSGVGAGGTVGSRRAQDIVSLRRELADLQSRYTENHPEVRRLKKMIASLENQQAEGSGEKQDSTGAFSLTDLLKPQLEQVNSEIAGLRSEIKRVKEQMEFYERRVEETPKREQEMISLTRDYESIKDQYDNLTKRKLDADIALNMEMKQKGEQFLFLDPARLPENPVSPDVFRILLIALAVGLGLGYGIAFAAEMLDTSYSNPKEAEEELGLPVIGSLGYRYTKKEVRRQRFKEVLKGVSVSVGFGVSVLCVFLYTKGTDKTFDFIRKFFPWQM